MHGYCIFYSKNCFDNKNITALIMVAWNLELVLLFHHFFEQTQAAFWCSSLGKVLNNRRYESTFYRLPRGEMLIYVMFFNQSSCEVAEEN